MRKFLFALFVVLIILKLAGAIDWSWWVISIPVPIALVLNGIKAHMIHLYKLKHDTWYALKHDLKKLERRGK